MRLLSGLIALALIAGLGWLTFREGGWLNQVTQDRVQAALMANGVPSGVASCMAQRLTDKLTIGQLIKLERLKAQEGESAMPSSAAAALARLERVDDPEAVRVLASTGARCAVNGILDQLR